MIELEQDYRLQEGNHPGRLAASKHFRQVLLAEH